MIFVEKYYDQLRELCEKHNVKELFFFGSALTDDFNESSDIDILIQFDQIEISEYFSNFMDLKEELENLFCRSVDLVENQAIRNPVFRNVVDRDKQLIY